LWRTITDLTETFSKGFYSYGGKIEVETLQISVQGHWNFSNVSQSRELIFGIWLRQGYTWSVNC
jgi:hypothetical protein